MLDVPWRHRAALAALTTLAVACSIETRGALPSDGNDDLDAGGGGTAASDAEPSGGVGGSSATDGSATDAVATGGAASGGAGTSGGTGGTAASGGSSSGGSGGTTGGCTCGLVVEWEPNKALVPPQQLKPGEDCVVYEDQLYQAAGSDSIYDLNAHCPPSGERPEWCEQSVYVYEPCH